MDIEKFNKLMDTKLRQLLPYIVVISVMAMGVSLYNVNKSVTGLTLTIKAQNETIETRVASLEKENYTDAYDRGKAGLDSLVKMGLTTVEEIQDFYAPKPAGRMDMKEACRNQDVVNQLNKEYDGLLTTSCTAVN